ncbi:hypothetical protein [Pyramidobacter piscolens]|uniref:hypothetical protein n=1 Tax=Pyramidobacter piscolens TaxID=638849 RepID=UPI002AB1E1DA|nr:hypothetical protein [Pyramidobacter piscolens]
MTNEEYIKMQKMWLKATGIKEGSWVEVMREPKNYESGWSREYDPSPQRVFLEGVHRVVACHHTSGILLRYRGKDNVCFFPFFVLNPAEAPKPEKYQFKPFEQVLVRDEDSEVWDANLFNYTRGDGGGPFECVSCAWHQCIPYAGHEHLLGTTDEPEDWAKYYDKACYDKE